MSSLCSVVSEMIMGHMRFTNVHHSLNKAGAELETQEVKEGEGTERVV